jgi:hypothetical protein
VKHTRLAEAIFRQEGSADASGLWVTSSLGYRLNNPGNLNYAGQPGAVPTTLGNGSEAQFATLEQGIAATDAQLLLDASRGLTLAQRLQTWATGNKAAYLANVSAWLGVDPNTPLSELVGPNVAYNPGMTYLISWKTKNHAASAAKFAKHGLSLPAGIKLLASWHVVGEGRGFVVIESPDPKAVHKLSASWADMLDCSVSQVISDTDAKLALG